MLTVLLRNVRTDETLDLADISQNGSGAEALSGLTGFGLPPVEVQWFEGAGHGAQYRGYRVPARDFDIPLFVYEANRATLKTTLAQFSRVVAGPFMVEFYEDEVLDRYIEVSRVGGGTYTYGVDTKGETDWQSLITVRAGDPFFLHAEPEIITRTYATAGEYQPDNFDLVNTGTADVRPVWRFTGPLLGVTVSDGLGGDKATHQFQWIGNLNPGDVLTVDCEAATVTDQTGANRYNGIVSAPDFFAVPPGETVIGVYIDSNSALTRTNYVTNPTFGNATHGWTEAGPSDTAVSGGQLVVGEVESVTQNAYVPTTATKVISGFSAHSEETFMVRLTIDGADRGVILDVPHVITITTDEEIFVSHWATTGGTEFVHFFKALADGEVTIQVTDAWTQGKTVPLTIDTVYVGQPGAYFDGGTTDEDGYVYAWSGTANASTSTATATASVPQVEVETLARDWMVV